MMCFETDFVVMWVVILSFLWFVSTVVLVLSLSRTMARVRATDGRVFESTTALNDMVLHLHERVEALSVKPKRKTTRKKPAAKAAPKEPAPAKMPSAPSWENLRASPAAPQPTVVSAADLDTPDNGFSSN